MLNITIIIIIIITISFLGEIYLGKQIYKPQMGRRVLAIVDIPCAHDVQP